MEKPVVVGMLLSEFESNLSYSILHSSCLLSFPNLYISRFKGT